MNWKLIFQLSLFGLAMAIATVFVIPAHLEPAFWLVIFGVCAYLIARSRADRHFLHGLMVSIVNSVWITAAHLITFDQYVLKHPQEMAMMNSMPLADAPRVMMLIMGPIIGVLSGLVLGLFSWIAARFVKPVAA